MLHVRTDGHVLNLSVEGALDETAARDAARAVSERANGETRLIVLSLANATEVRWNALCRLGRAVGTWRRAYGEVIVRDPRPSLRAALAQVDGIGAS
jgi:anti-anti-sigma regulatory factor